MLILSGVLVLFLIIAVYFICILYEDFDSELNASYYQELEEKLENQAKIFVNEYYNEPLSNDKITITRSVLKNYNLDILLVDKLDNVCSGYVTVYKTHGKENYDGYIKCSKYMTVGYEGWKSE